MHKIRHIGCILFISGSSCFRVFIAFAVHNFFLYKFWGLFRFELVLRQNYSSKISITYTRRSKLRYLIMLLCAWNRLPKNITYFSLISSSALFLFVSFAFPIRNFHVVCFSRTIYIALFLEQCKQNASGCLWGMGVGGVMQLVFPELSLWTFNYILSAKSSKKRLAADSTQRRTTFSFARMARWTNSECGYTARVYNNMVVKMLCWGRFTRAPRMCNNGHFRVTAYVLCFTLTPTA